MKKFNWYTKQEIVDAIKMILMLASSFIGFFTLFLSTWLNLNLPIKWYAVVITFALAALSEVGLCVWIVKG